MPCVPALLRCLLLDVLAADGNTAAAQGYCWVMAGDVEDARRCFEDLGEGRITEHLREGPFLTTLRFMLGLAC